MMRTNDLHHSKKRLAMRLSAIGFFVSSLLLFSCGPKIIPKELEGPIDRRLSFEAIKTDPEAHRGKTVLLGGEIIETHNKKETTEIEILQKPLGRDDQPIWGDASNGRFLYIHPKFLDPSIYKSGRRVTVVGKIDGTRSQNVGDVEIIYPILAGEHLYLWPPLQPYPIDPAFGIGLGFGAVYSR